MSEESKLLSIFKDVNEAMYNWLKERKDISAVEVGRNQDDYIVIIVHSATFSLDTLTRENVESILPKIVCDNAERIIMTVEPDCYIRCA